MEYTHLEILFKLPRMLQMNKFFFFVVASSQYYIAKLISDDFLVQTANRSPFLRDRWYVMADLF